MRQILPDIYLIEGLRVAHVYVLISEEGLTLIDSGTPGETAKIAAQIEKAGYELSDVRAIVVTHAHSDHTGTLTELVRRSGAQVLAHRDEVDYLERTASLPYKAFVQRLLFGLSERVVFRFEPSYSSCPAVPRTKMSTNWATTSSAGICASGVPSSRPWLMAKANSMPKKACAAI
jgi:glyoxylase-like metal-dependent hydrolase (beta-lactamase superfamily II)